MSKDTRDFLVDLATWLRGHGYKRAASDVLDHINEQDAAA